MVKALDKFRNFSRFVLLVTAIAALGYVISRDVQKSWNIVIAVMGFSVVVFIHECGHFIFAKACDIKVETFSIFLPPILIGIRRTADGLRFRILPRFFPKEGEDDGDGLLCFTLPLKKSGKGETEYQIGLIPIAGYVKMLGQDDTGADKGNDDPRSFGNKGVLARMLVIVAGVVFNVIAAIVIMTIVYMVGIYRPPAIVGSVMPESPVAKAGIKAGDEIIEIGGKSDSLEFMNILAAAALSDKAEKVSLKVRHENGAVEDYSVAAEQRYDMPLRVFGIGWPLTLTVAAVIDDGVEEESGFRVGDEIRYVEGRQVRSHWEFMEVVEKSLTSEVTLAARRAGETEFVESGIKLDLSHADVQVNTESDLNHIYSMVPRLKVTLSSVGVDSNGLHVDDIILAVGDIENPIYTELREVTEAHEDKQLKVRVLRKAEGGVEKEFVVTVVPKKPHGSERVVIGIVVSYDAEHPVVAKTISAEGGVEALDIPRGAMITAVDGAGISSFYDIIREFRRNAGQRVAIDYRLDEKVAGDVTVDLSDVEKGLRVKSIVADFIAFEPMERLYKADNIGQAFVMGCKKSVWFIVQTYVTVKQLFARSVGLESMMGPVGIATLSYKAVEQSFVTFLYLLAFISANLAVINFLPIPVVDGGVFVLLIIEKIKGGPISIKLQEVITYAGLILLASLFLYLTYNDILRIIFG